ncbi:MAG TPA: putative toxin-antitoxin system toxin component, PIN family [Proteobacteria bacterium]|nr:putative toxin-antitoxin system toxin component, PIN family [Pseudomonadota bacterium]
MGKKTKVVIDTNVMVSAFGWHGKPEEIVRLVTKGRITNFISIEILTELGRVLSYAKFKFSEALQVEIIETVFSMSSVVSTSEPLNIIVDDPEDNKILECAASAKVDFIITGDKHLLNLKSFRGVEILTPEEFLLKWSGT